MISSAARTLLILEQIGRSDEPISVTDLARQLGMVAGTVFRGLNALESAGFVQRYQSSSRYVLGPVAVQLHHRILTEFGLRDLGTPYLEQLAVLTSESIAMTVPVGWYGLSLAVVSGTSDVTSVSRVGDIEFLGSDYRSQVLLAFLPAASIKAYAAWESSKRGVKLASSDLPRALVEIRDQGYALNVAPFAPDRAYAAFPVRQGDQVIASISLEGPAIDFANRHDQVEHLMGVVREFERAIASKVPVVRNPFAHLDRGGISFNSVDAEL